TGGKKSLDDVIKSLYRQCKRGNGPGFGEDDIKLTVNRVAGQDLSAFYDKLARSTDEMPFDECLGYAGLKLSQSGAEERGASGMAVRPDTEFRALEVARVFPGGAAEKAG